MRSDIYTTLLPCIQQLPKLFPNTNHGWLRLTKHSIADLCCITRDYGVACRQPCSVLIRPN